MIVTSRDIKRLTRRSFLTGGIAAGAGFASWLWIRDSLHAGGIPAPLRHAEEADDVFSHALFRETRLARTFSDADIGEARANGDLGLQDDVEPDWKLLIDDADPVSLDQIKALPKLEQITQFKCIEGWNYIMKWAGVKFSDFAALCQNVGGARIVVTVNGFTDSAASAGAFAAFALSNHIPVSVWELCNEPYTLAGSGGLAAGDFFLNATDYVAQMKPFRNAIKAADSNAVVAIYFNDAGYAEPNIWDNDLKNYTDKWWDAVAYHHYPSLPTSGVTFTDLMALDNWQLASNTTARVTNYLIPDNNPGVTFLISEFNPARGDGAGGNYPPTTTLYGAIYTAEYLLRMSTLPQMQFVGPFQLTSSTGIGVTNNFYNPVTTAYAGNYTTNTAGWPFGFYLTAQVCGSAVANGALYHSTAVFPTTVGTNCPTVPAEDSSDNVTPIQAIYAQAYQGGNGKRYVVLTNKGTNTVPVQITQDGVVLTNSFLETYVTGSDPSATNSSPQNSPVQIKTATVTNSVTIPEYSVVRLEWTISNVPPPTLALTLSQTDQNLHWTGQTNVIYNVQGATRAC